MRRSTRAGSAIMPLALGGLLGLAGFAAPASSRTVPAPPSAPALAVLPAARAVPGRVDTLYLGGYADGSFSQALRTLASDLSEAERRMVGRHLDKIFLPLLPEEGLGRGGRLRVAYERVVRPDGSTRSIQVLAAEAAVNGSLHKAFHYDGPERAGYYDERGLSLDPAAWARPLESARVTSPFRMDRMHPILHRVLPHTGIDYAAAAGTPVRATGDGSVVFAGSRGGYGNLVEVQHPNGYATRYAHLSRIARDAAPGSMVSQGDVIGYVGMTGLATGPHLHYEVRRRGRPVDPESVSPDEGPGRDLGLAPGWRVERRRLAGLLAKAPTLLSVRRGSGSSGD